ncbi:MAG: class I SAM-dependent methyltransferase, partial [Chromatiaceae bacterium]
MSAEKRDAANAAPGAQGMVGDRLPSQTSLLGGSLWIERQLLQWVLAQLGRAPLCFVLWDGSRVTPSGVEPECDLHVSDRGALWRLMSHPEYQFPEMYMQGRVGLGDDLEHVLNIVQRTRLKSDPNSLPRRLLSALYRRRSGSPARARENIHSHYDLGNDFYKLWLDDQMVYTCA